MGQSRVATDKKGARRRKSWICFQDESGFSLLPAVRATWAPRGRTPVLRHRFGWTRMSMSAALLYRPDGSQASLVFQTKPGSYNTESLIEFLTDLHDQLDGDPVTLIWDGLSAHRSKDMKGLAGHPATLAPSRATARLRTRTQPRRTGMGQHQSNRARQPLPRGHRRSRHRRTRRPEPYRQQLPAQLRLPRPHRFSTYNQDQSTRRKINSAVGLCGDKQAIRPT